jgi:transposase
MLKDATALDLRDQRIAELEAQVRQGEARLAELQQKLADLQARLAELERASKRQATPFARQKHKAQRQRPGRKAGQGKFAWRMPPPLEQVTATTEARLPGCPECGGRLQARKTHEQFVIDLPEAPPTVTRYVTHSGQCPRCQKRVRSRHPEQISAATGAAGVVIGPRAKALAADWKHRLGVSYAKVAEMLEVAFGLSFTRSGICQADTRLALAQARPVYAELVDLMRQSAVVHADETGWRIGLLSAWLWVFTNRALTVYTVQTSRGHEVVVELLGREFRGTLVTDCFTAYDHRALADWLQQKCVGHLLKDLKVMRETKTRGAVRFAQDVTALLRDALALREKKPDISVYKFHTEVVALEHRLDRLIDPRRKLTDPDNQRFAKRLRKQRPHLLRFLHTDGLDPTNNQAERMLRPAVITRKTNGCNRTERGALAHAILASILVTCRQQGLPLLEALVKIQRAAQANASLLGLPQLPAPPGR